MKASDTSLTDRRSDRHVLYLMLLVGAMALLMLFFEVMGQFGWDESNLQSWGEIAAVISALHRPIRSTGKAAPAVAA